MGERCIQGFGWDSWGKRLFERTRSRWDYNKINLQEVGWGIDWIYLAEGRERWWTLAN